MAQPEPAADPSMEEILASIRRIIAEDGAEPPAKAPKLSIVAERTVSEPPAASTRPPDEPAIHENAAEIASDEFAEEASVADALAEALDALGDPDESTEQPHPAAPSRPDAPESASVRVSAETAAATAIRHAIAEPAASRPDLSSERQAGFAERATSRSSDQESAAQESAARSASLLSATSGEKVQSAFDQLADTIFTKQAPTLEDIVKDMMRPMLKHWLDDNLPVLVERLVREEIERVSRGRR